MKVERDFQIAIDQSNTSEFIELLEKGQETSITCSILPSGQPHSCDNPKEVWGHVTSIFTKLNIASESTENEYGTIKEKGEVITLSLNSSQIQDLIAIIKGAISTPVFFEYEHCLLLENESCELVRLNVWGWCQNGEIEYAN